MKIFLIIAAIMSLVFVSFVVSGALSDTAGTGASVTVNTFVDITLGVCTGGGAGSINYGSNDPGDVNVIPVNCHNASNGDVTVTVEATTNTPVNIGVKGTDYTGVGTIDVGQTDWDDNEAHGSPTALTLSSVNAFSSVGGVGSAVDSQFYFQLDIPGTFLTAGSYSSTYTFDAS